MQHVHKISNFLVIEPIYEEQKALIAIVRILRYFEICIVEKIIF